ncbi:MAG: ABC transporter permease [Dictyoglomus sp. NZ13-RE01]|nr:MAG: ABC transporter permease [Dictyoglomus sp. NZ13-RE01]
MRERKLVIFLTFLPSLIFLSFLFIYPFFYGLYLSFTGKANEFTLENYIRFFSDPWEVATIFTTFKIALPATIINILLAIPFAYYMRHGVKGEKVITFFLILPVTLGTVLVAEGMLTYFGPVGWFNQFLKTIGVIKEPLKLTHNYTGVLLGLIVHGFPYAFLMLLGYISGIDPNLEKAAQMLGANKWQIFRRVIFPLWIPGITIAFSLNFVMAFSVFPTAVLLGQPSGPTRVMSISIFHWAFEKFDFNTASAIAIIMGLIELIVILIVMFWRQKMFKGGTFVGKA